MKKLSKAFVLVGMLGFLAACGGSGGDKSSQASSEPPASSSEDIDDGRELVEDELYTDDGLRIVFNKRGARISKITFDDLEIAKDGFIAGRCANRIGGASFDLNGETYNLDVNDGANHLHGGSMGFGEVDWTKKAQTPSSITYTLHSADGDMGYPGALDIEVKYTLRNNGALMIEYSAVSDADTILNPTNHIWLSLNGMKSSSNHTLMIDADEYTETDSALIPTGRILPVEGTVYDYREEKEFEPSNNYDDNWVLNGTGYRKVAALAGTDLGIRCDIYTDRPGLQLYNNGNYIVMETQLYPDAIHHPDWPSPILRAGEDFYTKTEYVFTAE